MLSWSAVLRLGTMTLPEKDFRNKDLQQTPKNMRTRIFKYHVALDWISSFLGRQRDAIFRKLTNSVDHARYLLFRVSCISSFFAPAHLIFQKNNIKKLEQVCIFGKFGFALGQRLIFIQRRKVRMQFNGFFSPMRYCLIDALHIFACIHLLYWLNYPPWQLILKLRLNLKC